MKKGIKNNIHLFVNFLVNPQYIPIRPNIKAIIGFITLANSKAPVRESEKNKIKQKNKNNVAYSFFQNKKMNITKPTIAPTIVLIKAIVNTIPKL